MDTTHVTIPTPMSESQLVKLAFGRVVTAHREDAGYKQRMFSRVTGISNSHLRGIEKGEVSPTIVTLFKIASSLDVKPSELVSETYDAALQAALKMTVEYLEDDED